MRFIFFVVILLVAGCAKEAQTYTPAQGDCPSGPLTYHDIQPIIGVNCSGPLCHTTGTGNYDFSNYENVANSIRQGAFQYRLLLPVEDPQHMPTQIGDQSETTGRKLADCDLYKILSWINQGYPQ